MTIVDDRGVIGIGEQRRIHCRSRRLQPLDDPRLLFRRHQHVIRREADLPGVEHLAERDAFGRLRQIGGPADDDRRFPAKLERHRRQVIGGGVKNMPPDAGRAGEQQVIERQFGKRLADVRSTGKEREFLAGEIIAGNLFEQRGGARREFAGLDHRPIARGERAGDWPHHQIDREIPRRDDPNDALRLIFHPGLRPQQAKGELHRTLVLRGPCVQMLDCVIDRADRAGDIGDHRLLAAAVPEILRQRLAETIGIVGNHRRRAPQPVLPDR